MRKKFVEHLVELASEDESIYLVTGDLGFGVLEPFIERFPKQFLNAGIAEQTMASLSGGLASLGNSVFMYSIGNFASLRCLEQIRNDVVSMENFVVAVSVGAGFAYGAQGYTHHAIEDLAVVRALRGMNIYSPADDFEVVQAMNQILAERHPAYLRLGKGDEVAVHGHTSVGSIADGYMLRGGNDVAILTTGSICVEALNAAKKLEESGISTAIFSVPKSQPIDLTRIMDTITDQQLIVTVEEHLPVGGFGSAVLEWLGRNRCVRPVEVIGANYSGQELGDQAYLRDLCGLSAEQIFIKVQTALEEFGL